MTINRTRTSLVFKGGHNDDGDDAKRHLLAGRGRSPPTLPSAPGRSDKMQRNCRLHPQPTVGKPRACAVFYKTSERTWAHNANEASASVHARSHRSAVTPKPTTQEYHITVEPRSAIPRTASSHEHLNGKTNAIAAYIAPEPASLCRARKPTRCQPPVHHDPH